MWHQRINVAVFGICDTQCWQTWSDSVLTSDVNVFQFVICDVWTVNVQVVLCSSSGVELRDKNDDRQAGSNGGHLREKGNQTERCEHCTFIIELWTWRQPIWYQLLLQLLLLLVIVNLFRNEMLAWSDQYTVTFLRNGDYPVYFLMWACWVCFHPSHLMSLFITEYCTVMCN